MNKETVLCEICGKDTGIVPIGCCSGRDCGCMGMPINMPFVCSNECYDKLMNEKTKTSHL